MLSFVNFGFGWRAFYNRNFTKQSFIDFRFGWRAFYDRNHLRIRTRKEGNILRKHQDHTRHLMLLLRLWKSMYWLNYITFCAWCFCSNCEKVCIGLTISHSVLDAFAQIVIKGISKIRADWLAWIKDNVSEWSHMSAVSVS